MPVLNLQYTAQTQAPDGSTVQVAPSMALAQRGPFVQVTVGVAQSVAQQLAQQGQVIPAPISGVGLIDTGATTTCIDDATAQQLQLPVVDVVKMASASHAATDQNVYPASVDILPGPININAPRVMGANLAPQGLLLLIGRDVLQFCTLFYNGPAGQISLAL